MADAGEHNRHISGDGLDRCERLIVVRKYEVRGIGKEFGS
jgi:hypothetical protein